ncbi:MAG: toast rack family protein [Acidobacteriota bacterium]
MARRFFICLGILTLVSGVFMSCVEGERRPRREMAVSTPLEGVTSAEVEIRMPAGELEVSGAPLDVLMSGSLRFSSRRREPRVHFQKSGDRGFLRIAHRRHGIFIGASRNQWDIQLTESIPLDLKLDLGAGEARLDLRGLKVKSLDIDMGVGELEIDLSDKRSADLEVKIDGGIGHGRVYFPSSVGVRVRVDGGLGSVDAPGFEKRGDVYTNDALGKSPVTIEVSVDAGIGSIDLRMKDSL